MARILYAIMGDARGHLSRSLSVVQQMEQHEFLFAGGNNILELREKGYSVYELPILGTYYKNTRADIVATTRNALHLLFRRGEIIKGVIKKIEEFKPDLIVSDYEYFVPIAAKRMGLPCISLDHQHILTHCKYTPPKGMLIDRVLTLLPIKYLFSNASNYIVSSFFQLTPLNPDVTRVVPPILRKHVLEHSPSKGDHALVYTSAGSYSVILPLLESIDRQFLVYGFGEHPKRKNILFKGFSQHDFLTDLSSARYVVSNAGHNLISEALYLQKPLACLPLHLMYEQFFNAYNLRKLGFGDFTSNVKEIPALLANMEENAEANEERIRQYNFWGNDSVVKLLEKELAKGRN